jgi:hypothetical protein
VDTISEHILKILDNIKVNTVQSIHKQIEDTQSASNFQKLSVKSNGGSFIAVNNTKSKGQSVLNAHIDGCIQNDFLELGTTCKSTKSFPMIMPYIYALKTLFIGYTDNIDNHLDIKDQLYPLMPMDMFKNKNKQMAMILSFGKSNETIYQMGIKQNHGIILSFNHINDSNAIHLQYDNGPVIYINHSGLYATLNNNYRFGINISKFLPNIEQNNIKAYNLVTGYGSNGLFIMLFLQIFVEALNLYLVIELLYEDEMKISVRLHQGCTELETLDLTNTMNYMT